MTTEYSEHSQAVTALVLGIIGLFIPLLGPFAWKFGHDEIKAIDAGRRPPGGYGMATAGRILGIIGTVFLVLWIIAVLAVIPVFVATSSPQ